MQNECLLDMNTETISPPSSHIDQSLNRFSYNLTGRLGIVNLGTETVIHETESVLFDKALMGNDDEFGESNSEKANSFDEDTLDDNADDESSSASEAKK